MERLIIIFLIGMISFFMGCASEIDNGSRENPQSHGRDTQPPPSEVNHSYQDEGTVPERGSQDRKDILPKTCTGDADCEEGFSCWYQIPRGPSAGIPGSGERPGRCWRSEDIKRTY